MRRCLFVTPILPAGRDTGGLLFSQLIVDMLRAAGLDVTVLGWREAGASHAPGVGEIAVGMRPVITREHPLAATSWMARTIVRGEPYSIGKFRSAEFDRRVAEHARQADLVVVDHQLDWAFDRLPVGTPTVHVSHQLASAVYAPGASPLHRREARLLRRSAVRIARRADQVWTIAPDDRDRYREMGAAYACHLPYVPDPPPIACAEPPAHDVVLLGTWTWRANRTGLEWFLKRVAPRLSDLRIAIAGRGAMAYRRRGVTVLRSVDDDIAFLRSGRVIAIPSLEGVGVQIKSLRALAAGPQVVATPHAVRHMPERPSHLSLADAPESFAVAIRAALARPPASIGEPFTMRRAQLRESLAQALAALSDRDSATIIR